jgi:iron complex outermembrane receptor protein
MDLNRGVFRQGSTPRNQAGLRVAVDLPAGFQIDAAWRYASDIRSLPDLVAGGGVPGYTDLDLRCAWRTGRGVELSIVGRNLLHGQHVEFGAPAMRSAIERSVYGKVAWVF